MIDDKYLLEKICEATKNDFAVKAAYLSPVSYHKIVNNQFGRNKVELKTNAHGVQIYEFYGIPLYQVYNDAFHFHLHVEKVEVTSKSN